MPARQPSPNLPRRGGEAASGLSNRPSFGRQPVSIAEPADRSRGFLETGFFEDGIVRSLLEANGDLFVGDLDGPVRVDESTEDRLGSRVVETLQIVCETLVEHCRNHAYAQQILQGCATVPGVRDVQLAGWFTETGDRQNRRDLFPGNLLPA